jgi:hypothetical protein
MFNIKMVFSLERYQALCVMHELLVKFADSPIKKHLVIEPNPALAKPATDHIIKINCPLDDNTLKVIEPIAANRNLKIKKLPDAIVIN